MPKKKAKKAAAAPRRAAKKSAPRKAAKRAATKRAVAKRPAGPRVNAVVHWEIQSQNPAHLHRFYADAFGWKIDTNNPMNYGMVSSKGHQGGIDGGIGGSQHPGSRVTVYAAVPDIASVLDRIASLGGSILMPRTDIGPVVMALYGDPEGNVMGLIEG